MDNISMYMSLRNIKHLALLFRCSIYTTVLSLGFNLIIFFYFFSIYFFFSLDLYWSKMTILTEFSNGWVSDNIFDV